jgi:ribosomal protein L16/L10AE
MATIMTCLGTYKYKMSKNNRKQLTTSNHYFRTAKKATNHLANDSIGSLSLVTNRSAFITTNQLTSVLKQLKQYKYLKLWKPNLCSYSITKKAQESRMGSGKSSIKYWCLYAQQNNSIFESKGIITNKIFKKFNVKLPFQCVVLKRKL